MQYQDSTDSLNTAKKILKVNHAGEFGAINIYRAQILVSQVFRKDLVPLLESLMEDERRHLSVFWAEIVRRDGVKCKSYWLCGAGGLVMGFISAVFGKTGIMACTWAVESTVVNHLHHQLLFLKDKGDRKAYDAVQSILLDEEMHRDIGSAQGGKNMLYGPFRFLVATFTEAVIRIGMR